MRPQQLRMSGSDYHKLPEAYDKPSDVSTTWICEQITDTAPAARRDVQVKRFELVRPAAAGKSFILAHGYSARVG